jgi:hypothetical protein
MRGMSDDAIRADQPRLRRLERIVSALPQVRAIFLIDRDGRPLASSQLARVPSDFNVRDRSFFSVHVPGHAGIYVSEVMTPRLTDLDTPFFILSRRRPSAAGSFDGVTAVAVLPQYFEEFYALIGHSPGSSFALTRPRTRTSPCPSPRRAAPSRAWQRAPHGHRGRSGTGHLHHPAFAAR